MPRTAKQYDDKLLVRIVDHVSKMLRYHREEAGISQTKLAKLAGMSISTIYEIEKGMVNDVRLSTITTLARHLKIDPMKLISTEKLDLDEKDKKDFLAAVKTLDRISRRLG